MLKDTGAFEVLVDILQLAKLIKEKYLPASCGFVNSPGFVLVCLLFQKKCKVDT
jgi:hypothetical protein